MSAIKICGIKRIDDALAAAEFGVNAIGFNFYRKSKRYITPEMAKKIIDEIPPFICVVGVFVNEEIETVRHIYDYCGIDVIQLHGDESPDYCEKLQKRIIKAFRLKDESDIEKINLYNVNGVLVDSFKEGEYGGTGIEFNENIIKRIRDRKKLILAGGLRVDNVEEAILKIKPYGIDVCSGVEVEPGIKDKEKMRLFVERARRAFLKISMRGDDRSEEVSG